MSHIGALSPEPIGLATSQNVVPAGAYTMTASIVRGGAAPAAAAWAFWLEG